MKKIIMLALMLICITISNIVLASVNSNHDFGFIRPKEVNFKIKNLYITGKLPYINKFKDAAFGNQINKKIEAIYKKKLEFALSKNMKSVRFRYKAKTGNDIISILIYFSGTINDLETISFDVESCNFVTLRDILGPNAIEIINKTIKDETIKLPDTYNIDFTGIDNDHSNFFVDNDNLFIVFNAYELSPSIKDIRQFGINITNVKNKTLAAKDYYTTDLYNLKMIPIREICESFGYKISWLNNRIEVIGDDFLTTVLVNKNSYTKNKLPTQTLESAACIKNDRTYVPVSFFKEYLNLFYTVDQNDNITFTQYIPNGSPIK